VSDAYPIRHHVYETVDPATPHPASRVFRAVHHLAVIAGIGAMIAETMPALAASYRTMLTVAYDGALAFFVAEYLLRLYAAAEAPWAHSGEEWKARLHWARSLAGVIDFAAMLPLAASVPSLDRQAMHLLGAVWLLKLAPYSTGIALLVRVLRNARSQLLSVFLAFVMILLAAATLQYLLEREGQPDTFGSIPSALWWTIVTLTTTGYGDAVPATIGGRLLAGLVMICGIAIFALWAGILASGFAEEIKRREFLRTWDLVAKVPFFRNVGAATIADVARLLRPREVAAGSTVVRRGQPGDCMYFVVDGEVEIRVRPSPVRLGPGSFFGEIALITGAPRTATVVATQPTMLLVLDLLDFRDLAARRPELTKVISDEADRRLLQAQSSADVPSVT
jgi:voltage-gated potassium channel